MTLLARHARLDHHRPAARRAVPPGQAHPAGPAARRRPADERLARARALPRRLAGVLRLRAERAQQGVGAPRAARCRTTRPRTRRRACSRRPSRRSARPPPRRAADVPRRRSARRSDPPRRPRGRRGRRRRARRVLGAARLRGGRAARDAARAVAVGRARRHADPPAVRRRRRSSPPEGHVAVVAADYDATLARLRDAGLRARAAHASTGARRARS